jgi:hypothetical protein
MFSDHVRNQIQRHDLVSDSTLHVIGVISNSARFHSRYRLAREWQDRMRATANVELHMVELAFGDRHHEVTLPGTADLQLRSSHEIWFKENLINLGVQRLLPRNWKYVAWVDCDVIFNQPNWALETIHLLQHYPIVQPWTQAIDLGPHGSAMAMHQSFCGLVQRGARIQRHPGEPYAYGHSGYAWACTREFWENAGGLLDVAILGSADHHMAWALVNDVIDASVHRGMSDGFKRACLAWQKNAFAQTRGVVAAVPGTITHEWHGSKKARRYRERWQILIDNKFDPETDLRRDPQGLYYLVNKPRLEHEIHRYMHERNEDGIDE